MLGAPLSNLGGDDSSARGTSAWETEAIGNIE